MIEFKYYHSVTSNEIMNLGNDQCLATPQKTTSNEGPTDWNVPHITVYKEVYLLKKYLYVHLKPEGHQTSRPNYQSTGNTGYRKVF